MGCNTSQEQLQAGSPGVIENQNTDNPTYAENKDPDDNQNVTNFEKAEQKNAINGIDNVDKATHCDNLITEYGNDNDEEKDKDSDKLSADSSLSIKTEIQNSKERDGEERAATKIQATFRGHRVRASMKQGDKSTTGITMEKKCEDKNSNTASSAAGSSQNAVEEAEPTKEQLEAEFDPNDKELCDAAMRIQSAFRGHLNRKLQTSDIQDDKDLEEITKKVAEELDIDLTDPELNKAATKIQASFRGYKTRKDI